MQTSTKRSLLAMISLGVIALMVGAGSLAYFSSTSTVENNLFTAGTISLSVGGDIPLSAKLSDLKPCMKGEGTITVTNDGTNPFDLYLKIENVVTANGVEPAAEFAEDPTHLVNDIDGVIRYDLKFGDTVVIDDGCDYTISDGTHQLNHVTTGVKDKYIFVGNILPGEDIDVTQSFTMDGATTNWAQGDTMTFDVTFYAQQSEGNPPAVTPQLVIDPQVCPSGVTDLCEEPEPLTCGGESGCDLLGESACDLTCFWNDGDGSCTGGAVCVGLTEPACTDTVPDDLVCSWTPAVAGSCDGANAICDGVAEGMCPTTLDYSAFCEDEYAPIDPLCASIVVAGTCVANPSCSWHPDTYCVWTATVPGSCAGETGCSAYTVQADCEQSETTDCDWTAGTPFCDGDNNCDLRGIGNCDLDCTWGTPP